MRRGSGKTMNMMGSGTSEDLPQAVERAQVLARLGLMEIDSVPLFDEATQMAARFLDVPICTLSLFHEGFEVLKSAVGLSRLGLMNEIASSRQIPLAQSLGRHVVETQQRLVISDASKKDSEFSANPLVKRYRIRAYLGVPLFDSSATCFGVLAVMDLAPRDLSIRDVEFLELTARWSVSEYERNFWSRNGSEGHHSATVASRSTQSWAMPQSYRGSGLAQVGSLDVDEAIPLSDVLPDDQIKVRLLGQLTQELRTPLTSVIGMSRVLSQEVYGDLTHKQKEYMSLVYQSGQYMLSLVTEMLELVALNDASSALDLAAVDIEMLCQQAIKTLERAADRRGQEISLSIEPGNRIWLLDRNKVRQMLYHLIFTIIQASNAGSVVRMHVSRKRQRLHIAIWVAHPWLGENLPYAAMYPPPADAYPLAPDFLPPEDEDEEDYDEIDEDEEYEEEYDDTEAEEDEPDEEGDEIDEILPSQLGLLLSYRLAEVHGAQITIQGSVESGYRYVISLPQIRESRLLSR